MKAARNRSTARPANFFIDEPSWPSTLRLSTVFGEESSEMF
jgi:hypothetical protein